jgi:hypothetical protein
MLLTIVKLVLAALVATGSAAPPTGTVVYKSPDATIRVLVIPIGKKGYEAQESRIEVRSSGDRLLRWRSFASIDGEHGRGVNHGEWTRDAQFFVFNADSSGGHMPWNLATYFYSRRENRFYRLDDFIGPVTSDFTLTGKNSVKTTRFTFDKEEERERVIVKLEGLTKRKPKTKKR